MSRKLALATVLTLVVALGTALPAARAAEVWENALGQADYLFGLGRYEEARSAYRALLDQYPGTLGVDKAVVGIAKTHLAEGDYRTGVTFLEDVLVKSSDLATRAEARTLYCDLERTIRTAEARAVAAVAEAQTAYDDLSWWNIFKIFTKLRLRSDLKSAEKDQARISELHDLFNPNLLLPDAFAEATTTDSTDATADTTGATTTSADATDATTTAGDMDRVRAYEILQDDIAALIALIPAEPTDTTTTASADDTDETTEADEGEDESEDAQDETTEAADAAEDTASVVGSELTSDTSTETTPVVTSVAIAEETTEPTEVIGAGDEVTSTEAEEPTTASTATVETTTSAEATVETTPVTVTEQPAAPATVAELRQAYISAYNLYLQAHQGGDSAGIQAALNAYRRALQAYTDAQNKLVRDTGPSAPSTTDAPSAPGTTSPRSSVTTVLPTGRAVIGGSVLPTDRGGRVQFGDRNNGTRSSRTGLQGN